MLSQIRSQIRVRVLTEIRGIYAVPTVISPQKIRFGTTLAILLWALCFGRYTICNTMLNTIANNQRVPLMAVFCWMQTVCLRWMWLVCGRFVTAVMEPEPSQPATANTSKPLFKVNNGFQGTAECNHESMANVTNNPFYIGSAVKVNLIRCHVSWCMSASAKGSLTLLWSQPKLRQKCHVQTLIWLLQLSQTY
jgi:hypothetical protein